MRRFLCGLAAVCLTAALAADDAIAWPGGARALAGPGRNAGAVGARHQAGPPLGSSQRGLPGGAGPNRQGPARHTPPDTSGLPPRAGGADRHGPPPRVHDYQRFFDGQRPNGRQHPPQRAPVTAYGWANPAHRPFTPGWYAHHPKAWQATHPHADVVAAAGAVGLARWLAVPSVWVGGGETVIYSAGAEAVPVGEQPSYETSSAAGTLAASGGRAVEDGRWMTIGEFAFGPEGQGDATRVIQLVVSQDGVVRGSHYDLISEEVQDVRGAVDKKDLRIAWTIGPSSKVVFQAPLGELTEAEGRVTAYFPDGKQAAWRVVRLAQ